MTNIITCHGIKAAKEAMKHIKALGGKVEEEGGVSILGEWEVGEITADVGNAEILQPLGRTKAHIQIPGTRVTGDVSETEGSLVHIEYEPAETFEVPRLESAKSGAKLVETNPPEPPTTPPIEDDDDGKDTE